MKYTAAKIIKGGYKVADLTADMIKFGGEHLKDAKDRIDEVWAKATELARQHGWKETLEPTSIKNEVTNQERAKAGIPEHPAADPVGHSFPELRQQVLDIVQSEPTRTDRLVAELKEKPRPATDLEDALLLHKENQVRVEYSNALKELSAARGGDPAKVAELEHAESYLRDQLRDITDVAKAVGTEQGRALAARRMMVREDFSLDQMVLRKEAAKGEKLTPDEVAKVAELNNKIQELQAKLDAQESIAARRPVEKLMSQPRKVAARAEVEAAWENLRKVTGGKLFSTPVDPEIILATAKLAKAYIHLGVASVHDFVAQVKAKSGHDLGETELAALEEGWKKANEKPLNVLQQRKARYELRKQRNSLRRG